MINKIKNNFWKIFIQTVLNIFFLFLILNLANSRVLFIVFGISLVLEMLGMLLISYYLECVKRSLNVTKNITNNKYVILDPIDINKNSKK